MAFIVSAQGQGQGMKKGSDTCERVACLAWYLEAASDGLPTSKDTTATALMLGEEGWDIVVAMGRKGSHG